MAKTYMWRYLPCKTGGTYLTDDQVFEVRYLYQEEGFSRYKIAKLMHCSWPCVNNIIRHYKLYKVTKNLYPKKFLPYTPLIHQFFLTSKSLLHNVAISGCGLSVI